MCDACSSSKKMPKAPKVKYTQESLQKAIAEVQNNEQQLSDRQIAQKYGVPRSTLRFYKRNPGHKTSLGPSTILTPNEEAILEEWIITSARKGFPKNKENIIDSVHKFLVENPRPNPFSNNRPGIGWWKAFLKRHPKLSIRASEGVTKASSCVSEKDIRGWFDEIHAYAEEKGLTEVLNQPSRVFNADETNFQICLSSGLVVAEKGSKNVYNIEHSSAKESITALFTFSAAGDVCCPFIVYPYQRLPEKICESLPEGWGIGKSDNGWMTTEVFYEFIANVFHPYLVKKAVQLPVILYVDGHKTHLNYHLSQLCTHLQIELIALYPNATRIIQPADVSAFRPLKIGWRRYLKKWQLTNQNKGITKLNFAPILNTVLEESLRPEILVNGFRACGLCPFNANSIDYSKCLGKTADCQRDLDKDISDNVSITYKTFKDITGASLCQKFKDQSFHTTEPHLNIIYNLWKQFQNNADIANTSNKPPTNQAETSSPLINLTEVLDEVQVENQVKDPPIEVDSLPNTSLSDQIPYYLHCLPGTSKSDDHFEIQSQSSQSESATLTTMIESPKLVKIKSSFGEYLAYPKTPIRKGKRQIERQPFAITSDSFKLGLQKKQSDKENLLKEKEKKKIEREMKKTEKSKKELSKGKTKAQSTKEVMTNYVESNSSIIPESKKITILEEIHMKPMSVTCGVCKHIILKNNIECSGCHLSFHLRCIPDSHKNNIPDDADMMLFLCHFCYKVDDSDNDSYSDCEELYFNVQKARRDLNF